MSTDRAAVIARAVLQLTAQHILQIEPDQVSLHAAVATLLRDEFASVQHQTLSEIRLNDE